MAVNALQRSADSIIPIITCPQCDDHFGQLVANSELLQRELVQTTLSIRATTVRTHEVIASSRDLLATIEKLLAR